MSRFDELGAHMSIAGGYHNACGHAARVDTQVVQIFTKQPSRWKDPEVTDEKVEAFRAAREEHGIHTVISHDSYLLNCATPKEDLLEKSRRGMQNELKRCAALGIELVCSHPGNATDGDRERGIAQNAEVVSEALLAVPGPTVFCFETTAGTGSALGCTFEELAALIEAVDPRVRDRVGIVFDTCHAWAAGYDLKGDYDGVIANLDDVVGLDRLRAFHLNDSKHPLGSRKDRHEWIGDGHLGSEPFRRIMLDERLTDVPKFLETPKKDDPAASDRENLSRLRAHRS